MTDIIDARHEALVEHLFRRVCIVLEMREFELRPLRRRVRGEGNFHSYRLGYTRLGTTLVTIDLYTPRTMKPRKMDAILRVICHELAHHQEPPRLARVRRKLIRYSHHPDFWKQCKANVARCREDELLGAYFEG